jgi:hypothetical protein
MIPFKKKKYRIKVPIEVTTAETKSMPHNQQIEVFGEGGDGS